MDEHNYEQCERELNQLLKTQSINFESYIHMCQLAASLNTLKDIPVKSRKKFMYSSDQPINFNRFIATLGECFCSLFEAIDHEDKEIIQEEKKQIAQLVQAYHNGKYQNNIYMTQWECEGEEANEHIMRENRVYYSILSRKNKLSFGNLKSINEQQGQNQERQEINKKYSSLLKKLRRKRVQTDLQKWQQSKGNNLYLLQMIARK